jgi:hypothetical protein
MRGVGAKQKRANGTVTVAAPLASAVLAFEPFFKTGMASADLILLSHPLRNIEPIFTALTVPTALMRRSLIAALAV